MSTLLQDRLAAALAARAEQVTAQDLRPVEVPEPAHHSWRPVLLALAAAAAVAAVVVPLATGGPAGDPSPIPPATSTTPTPTPHAVDEVASARGDVDGDGREDVVRLDTDSMLRLELAGQEVAVLTEQPDGTELVGLADIGAPGLAVVLESPPGYDTGGTDTEARVLRWEGHAFVGVETRDQAWIGRSDGQTFWVADQVLYTGSLDPADADKDKVLVHGQAWKLVGTTLRPAQVGALCWEPNEQEHPIPCGGKSFGLDVGPAAGLPKLFPAVPTTARVGQRIVFAFTGEEAHDSMVLEGSKAEDYVDAGDVELVVNLDGTEHRVDVPAGGAPYLLTEQVRARGDAPVFVVTQEGGDSTTWTVFTFWNGKLQALPQPTDVPFGSGFRVLDGDPVPHRTWLSLEGVLYTAEEMDAKTGRHRLWSWSDDIGDRLTGQDLGVVCLDFGSSPARYGSCP